MALSLDGYLSILIGIIAICALGALVTPRYMRACPQCELPLDSTASYCRSCGYRPR